MKEYEALGFGEFLGYIYDHLEELKHDKLSFKVFGIDNGTAKFDYYFCIDNPFYGGYGDINKNIEVFKRFLKVNNIQYEGEVDLYGGLEYN